MGSSVLLARVFSEIRIGVSTQHGGPRMFVGGSGQAIGLGIVLIVYYSLALFNWVHTGNRQTELDLSKGGVLPGKTAK